MPVKTVFISGPRKSGKTTLIQAMAREIFVHPPHVIRLIPESGDEPYLKLQDEMEEECFASYNWVTYTEDRVFEALPQAIKDIRGRRKYVTFLLEGDADPSLRHAYPYDFRVFVMPTPAGVHEVFRTTREAAAALKEVMDDTAAFASEIFGLFEGDPLSDSAGVKHRKIVHRGKAREELEVSAKQMGQFLGTPLGAEIASRIQLQPAYHGLPESDVVLINTAVGLRTPVLNECVRRIELLLTRIGVGDQQRNLLCWCNPLKTTDRSRRKLFERLASLWSEFL